MKDSYVFLLPSIYLSIYLCIHLSIYLSTYRSICMSSVTNTSHKHSHITRTHIHTHNSSLLLCVCVCVCVCVDCKMIPERQRKVGGKTKLSKLAVHLTCPLPRYPRESLYKKPFYPTFWRVLNHD